MTFEERVNRLNSYLKDYLGFVMKVRNFLQIAEDYPGLGKLRADIFNEATVLMYEIQAVLEGKDEQKET